MTMFKVKLISSDLNLLATQFQQIFIIYKYNKRTCAACSCYMSLPSTNSLSSSSILSDMNVTRMACTDEMILKKTIGNK